MRRSASGTVTSYDLGRTPGIRVFLCGRDGQRPSQLSAEGQIAAPTPSLQLARFSNPKSRTSRLLIQTPPPPPPPPPHGIICQRRRLPEGQTGAPKGARLPCVYLSRSGASGPGAKETGAAARFPARPRPRLPAAALNRFLHFPWLSSCRGREREAGCSTCPKVVLVLRPSIDRPISQVGRTRATRHVTSTLGHPADP